MDIFDSEKRSEIMAKIKGKDTKPEIKLRKALFAKGFRYRTNVKTLPGKPDIVLRKYKTVIFVNGCFWHGHKDCKYATTPKSNEAFWKEKIKMNQRRDELRAIQLQATGWTVVTIWECEISNQKGLENVVEQLIVILQEQLLSPNKITRYHYPNYEEAVRQLRYEQSEIFN
ncbi:MAG: very short patch repair endonuclease [Bacteroidales bacterium]|nr:very short patch repair endonuclease [Bacteroidales bacterium]